MPVTLGSTLVQRVNELARDEGVTPYVVLLAAYQTVLGRYSGQRTFLVGSPLAGRPRACFQRTVGYFVNPLPVRADLRGDPTFRELVHRVHDVVLGAIEHQNFPLTTAVRRSQPARHEIGHPIFQCVFALEKAHLDQHSALTRIVLGERGTTGFAGLEVSEFEVDRTATHFDLALTLSQVLGMVILATIPERRPTSSMYSSFFGEVVPFVAIF